MRSKKTNDKSSSYCSLYVKEEHPESFGHFSDTCLVLGERTFTEISKAGYSTRNQAITWNHPVTLKKVI